MRVQPLCLLHTDINKADDKLSLVQSRLACGFPSPAEDYIEKVPSLDRLLIKHPGATLIGRATGDSMIERGILDGSLIVIDQSIKPTHNATIVASIAGEYTIKILDLQNGLLRPANKNQKPIPLPEDLDVICEGVVTYCITPQGSIGFDC